MRRLVDSGRSCGVCLSSVSLEIPQGKGKHTQKGMDVRPSAEGLEDDLVIFYVLLSLPLVS